MTKADAYRRDGQIICVPCSDIEDRDRPARVQGIATCALCGEPIYSATIGSATAAAYGGMTPAQRRSLTGR